MLSSMNNPDFADLLPQTQNIIAHYNRLLTMGFAAEKESLEPVLTHFFPIPLYGNESMLQTTYLNRYHALVAYEKAKTVEPALDFRQFLFHQINRTHPLTDSGNNQGNNGDRHQRKRQKMDPSYVEHDNYNNYNSNTHNNNNDNNDTDSNNNYTTKAYY
jgi:hypothetical protein